MEVVAEFLVSFFVVEAASRLLLLAYSAQTGQGLARLSYLSGPFGPGRPQAGV